jgi:hypothetical protein
VPETGVSRALVWVERARFRGFSCSECAWRFYASSAPTVESFDEMMLFQIWEPHRHPRDGIHCSPFFEHRK